MVNVGGRSKGCSTCRQRRIKCDETRPICTRCQKRGLQCEGPKETAFITGTIVKSRRSPKPGKDRTERESKTPDYAAQPVSQLTVVPKFVEQEVFICYARKHLYPNGPIDLGLQALRLADLASLASDVRSASAIPIFPQAALSFATVYFGQQHYQERIVQDGYAMHGTALVQLNQALSDSQCYIHDEIILSVITLSILECLVPSGPRHYLQHMLGLQQLLELRGPQALTNCSLDTENMYKGVRFMILHASLRTRQPSMLASSEWKVALRAKCSPEEILEQDLYNVLADCTVLLAEQDKLAVAWEANAKTVHWQENALKHRALALIAELRAWKAEWDADEKNNYQDVYIDVESIQEYNKNEYPASFSPAMRFENNSSVRLLMLFNTALIYTLQILSSFSLQLPTTSLFHLLPRDSHTLQHELWSYIEQEHFSAGELLAALEIGRCIPECLGYHPCQPVSRYLSPLVQWAATMAWRTFSGNESVEGRWMIDLVRGKYGETFAVGMWEM